MPDSIRRQWFRVWFEAKATDSEIAEAIKQKERTIADCNQAILGLQDAKRAIRISKQVPDYIPIGLHE